MSAPASERDIQFRTMSGEQREALMVQVAKRYYDGGQTMGELARELGLTRWQASRLLTEARETGIVRIEIMPRAPRLPSLESRLQKRWGLKETVVVATGGETDPRLVLNAVARGAAQFLAGLGRVPLIGVSWGRTMSAVAAHLPPFWNEGVEVVLLNGAMNIRAPSVRTDNTAELFARSANGTATLLPVPAILGSAATRRALEEDPTIAGVLELGRRAPVICFGMGTIGPDSVLVQSGFVTEEETAALAEKGAVGDILSRYIDAHGRIVDEAIDARTIALDLARASARDLSIGVAAGRAKHAVARACLRAGYLGALVTDEETAGLLLAADG